MASITTCPHCHMRVLPRPDGTCPSCNGLINETEAPAPLKRSAAIVKSAPKSAARKKAGAKSGRAAPSAPLSAKEIEPVYRDYLQTAKDIWRMSVRAVNPYLIGGLVIFLALVGISFATWQPDLVEPKIRAPGPTTWLLILIGFILLVALIVIGFLQGNRRGNVEIRDLAREKPGLPAFYRAFLRRYWPKEDMISGPALDKFLAMIGKK
jgi:hypothetical protein